MSAKPANPSNTSANVLIVVAKRPAPGQTKTRLSPPLSLEQASTLYECFLGDTLDLMRQAPGVRAGKSDCQSDLRVPGVQLVIAYLPAGEGDYFARLAPDFELLQQDGFDLGSRLDNALTHYLELGYRSAVIMDSDSPTLPPHCLAAAFASLEDESSGSAAVSADVVIGPCEDGGYYLIGLKRPCPRLLRQVRMSTPHVTADTLAVAAEEGLRAALLPAWYDVDDLPSLRRLSAELAGAPAHLARRTRRALARPDLRRLLAASPGEHIPATPGVASTPGVEFPSPP